MWVWLYVMQFVLWFFVARENWYVTLPPSAQRSRKPASLIWTRVSRFFGNTLYLVAFGYYTIISFLGYNGASLAPPSHPENIRLILSIFY